MSGYYSGGTRKIAEGEDLIAIAFAESEREKVAPTDREGPSVGKAGERGTPTTGGYGVRPVAPVKPFPPPPTPRRKR